MSESIVQEAKKRSYTIQGIKITLDPEILDDFELLQMLKNVQEDALLIPDVFLRIVGEKQYETILGKLRDPETHRVSVKAATEFFVELIKRIAPKS